MRFEWDEAKNRANQRKHGFDFADAEEMFRGIVLVSPDLRDDYGKDRWVGHGFIRARAVQIVFSQREPDVIRIISLRKATTRERKELEKAVKDRLETN